MSCIRKKIGVYNALGGEGVGGAELCVAVLAEALAVSHDVEIVHHKQTLVSVRQLEQLFCVELDRVSLRYAPSVDRAYSILKNPVLRYREARNWRAKLSDPYNVFVVFTHEVPPFSWATKGILVVLFPTADLEFLREFKNDQSKILQFAKRLYHELEWRGRMRTYQRKFSISRFTQSWTKRRWNIDSGILYPPAGLPATSRNQSKELRIISVGRFTTHGHSKRQLEMMGVYAKLRSGKASDYQYCTVGGLTDLPDDKAYFEEVRSLGGEHGATAFANLGSDKLGLLLGASRIFWHASGYGVDEARNPELVEHYGISTVEAMSAGCVPLVIDRGGQREIVEHGISGFLWNTLEELASFTETLIADEALLERMSGAAMRRAEHFSRKRFVDEATTVVASLLAGEA